MCIVWMVFFYCSQFSAFSEIWKNSGASIFAFDPTELPIVTIYPFYIPIFIKMMANKEFNFVQRFVAPILAIAGSVFMVVAAVNAHAEKIPGYLILFAVVMIIGIIFIKKKPVETK